MTPELHLPNPNSAHKNNSCKATHLQLRNKTYLQYDHTLCLQLVQRKTTIPWINISYLTFSARNKIKQCQRKASINQFLLHRKQIFPSTKVNWIVKVNSDLGSLLLTWFNFDPSVDKSLHPMLCAGEITYPFPNFNGTLIWVWINH